MNCEAIEQDGEHAWEDSGEGFDVCQACGECRWPNERELEDAAFERYCAMHPEYLHLESAQ